MTQETDRDKHLPDLTVSRNAVSEPKTADVEHSESMYELIDAYRDVSVKDSENNAFTVLKGFQNHPSLAASLIRSSFLMHLAKSELDEVQKAISSTWSKLKVIPLRNSHSGTPTWLAVDYSFIQEDASTPDASEEVYQLLSDYIINNKHYLFIRQLSVNGLKEGFKEYRDIP